MRFKAQLNENSKLHAFHNELPEMNHNEIIGWESHKQKNIHTKVIYLLDDEIHPQIKKRFEIMAGMIKSSDVEIITLKSSEENFKMRIMDLIYLTDWISYYLAVLRQFDPSEIDFIHTLKNKLSES
jgi:glucose/mannose-6-phosphate isomerase